MARRKRDMSREVFYPVGDVARVLGWSRNRTKRWLEACGIKRTMNGGRWYTTRALLRQAWPEDADYVIAALSE